jgi:hypothetical protein
MARRPPTGFSALGRCAESTERSQTIVKSTATVGLYDPKTSIFYLRNTNSTGYSDLAFAYGPSGGGWLPIAGDWAQNGQDTIGLYSPATSQFYLRNTNDTGYANEAFAYGPAGAGWTPIVGGWNGSTGSSVPADGSTTGTGTTTTTTGFVNVRYTAGMLQMSPAPQNTAISGGTFSTIGQVTGGVIDLDYSGVGQDRSNDPTPVQGCITWDGAYQSLRVEPSAVDRIDLSTVAQSELAHLAGSSNLDAFSDDAIGGVSSTAVRHQGNNIDAALVSLEDVPRS